MYHSRSGTSTNTEVSHQFHHPATRGEPPNISIRGLRASSEISNRGRDGDDRESNCASTLGCIQEPLSLVDVPKAARRIAAVPLRGLGVSGACPRDQSLSLVGDIDSAEERTIPPKTHHTSYSPSISIETGVVAPGLCVSVLDDTSMQGLPAKKRVNGS